MNQPDPIQQYIEAASSLRDLTRQAHEAAKDLKATIKSFNEARNRIQEQADEQINECVSAGLKEYKDKLAEAIQTSEKAIYKRFGNIEKILTGEEDRAHGKQNLEEQVRELMSKLSPGEREVMYSWARLVLTSR
jgi:N-methylhydantoinase B/oxoprolinase/acetone carboxylase alpha subunit